MCRKKIRSWLTGIRTEKTPRKKRNPSPVVIVALQPPPCRRRTRARSPSWSRPKPRRMACHRRPLRWALQGPGVPRSPPVLRARPFPPSILINSSIHLSHPLFNIYTNHNHSSNNNNNPPFLLTRVFLPPLCRILRPNHTILPGHNRNPRSRLRREPVARTTIPFGRPSTRPHQLLLPRPPAHLLTILRLVMLSVPVPHRPSTVSLTRPLIIRSHSILLHRMPRRIITYPTYPLRRGLP